MTPRVRASIYVCVLLAMNAWFVKGLFFVDFTNNMRTNAGTFMAISRFILQHWPHLDWYPWWFAGEPFENTYSPMLHLMDAAFAFVTGCSTPRAFNFVTACLYASGPVFLFLFSWRVSKFLETSFVAALLYSLFSSSAMFSRIRTDLGGIWDPWRLKVLVFYGEGPHTAVLSILPLALLLLYLAIQTRKYTWMLAAALTMAGLVLTNAFAAVDLAVGSACLALALQFKKIPKAIIVVMITALAAYLWASPFLTPALIHTISTNSQWVEGDFRQAVLWPAQCVILALFIGAWLGTRWIPDYFTRFSLLFAYVFFAITAGFAIWNRAALPQPNRYAFEMDLAVPLALAFSLRPLILRMPRSAFAIIVVLLVAGGVRQTVHFSRYANAMTQGIDVRQTIEYKVASAIGQNVGGLRAFVSAQAGLWLNVFSDTPQMTSGHDPFDPNWVEAMARYTIYSGPNTGARDAEISILWLKAFGCHAIYVPGPKSRLYTKPFTHPEKFAGVLPVLWHAEDDTIYSVPERTKSLAHVVAEDAIVKHRPISGLDIDETLRYVAALDDPAMPGADMVWRSPNAGSIHTNMRPGQVLSVQVTYDPGWVALANGRAAAVSRDGLGLMEIQPSCDGACTVDLVFDGGMERKVCRILSWGMWVLALFGAAMAFRQRKLGSSHD